MEPKRYDLMIPDKFKLGIEKGIALAIEFNKGIEVGVRHFNPVTKLELKSVLEILQCIEVYDTLIFWGIDFGDDTLGITMFDKAGVSNIANVGMHPMIKEILFPDSEKL